MENGSSIEDIFNLACNGKWNIKKGKQHYAEKYIIWLQQSENNHGWNMQYIHAPVLISKHETNTEGCKRFEKE
eukprot:14326247-Ditylum_brightwellii.AAC.1